MAPDPGQSPILNYLVRMVVPMRREFGYQLDVHQFLRDGAYARSMLDTALGSQDPRLREYAAYVERRLHGARIADDAAPPTIPGVNRQAAPGPVPAAVPAAAAPPAAAPGEAPPAEEAPDTEASLRARMLRKYTSGLR